MEQQIRFCTTSDGIRIAYATIGDGPPLVYACGWPQHLELEWQTPFSRAFLEDLSQGFTLVRYDMRGGGLSDRDVADLSLDALVADLEAVVEHLNLERFPLMSLGLLAGPIAMSYAARHPGQVSHLILCSAFLRGGGVITPDRQKALVDFTAAFGFPIGDFTHDPVLTREEEIAVRKKEKAASSAGVQAELLRTLFSADVKDLAQRVSAPALVMHARKDPLIPFELGREVAAGLPRATFVPYQATGAGVWRHADAIIPEIRRFLGVKTVEVVREQASRVSGVHTILFTDVEGSTTLTHRLGDARAREVLRAHEGIVRTALEAYGGSEVKSMGDGFMASFTSASDALKCAIAMQRAFAQQNEAADEPIRVRMGVNAGEPIAEAEDLFGTAVNLAARIAAEAAGGQIIVSSVVRELAAGKGFLFADRGETALRGFEEPVRLYEVRWES
jgi:class 3 adenylate cyclase